MMSHNNNPFPTPILRWMVASAFVFSFNLAAVTTGLAATPSFAAQQIFATGAGPYVVTTTDINGDGKPDLIVANFNDNTVSVLLNTTPPGAVTSNYATQKTFATGTHPFTADDCEVVRCGDHTTSGRVNLAHLHPYQS